MMDMATMMQGVMQGGQAPSFGLGQQLMQGQMGNAQFAQPQTMMGQMQDSMGQMGGALQNMDPAKLQLLMQLMQQQQQGMGDQQQGMGAMMGHPGMGQNMAGMMGQNLQAGRGYLAQGGGIAPRNIIHRGY